MASPNPINDTAVRLFNATVAHDPQLQALTQQWRQATSTGVGQFSPEADQIGKAITARITQLNGGKPLGNGFMFDPYSGQFEHPRPVLDTVAPAMLGALVGGAGLGGAFSGGAVAAPTGATTGGTTAAATAGGTQAAEDTALGVGGSAAAKEAANQASDQATNAATNYGPDFMGPVNETGLPGGPAAGPDFSGPIDQPGAGSSGNIFDTLKKYGGAAGDIGKILGDASSASANANRQNAANNARAIAENNQAKTDAARYNLTLPSIRAGQVAHGDVLNTMQNSPLTGDPRIDKFSGGGLRPSAFGPTSRAAGAELSRQAMSGLMNPSQDRLTPQEIPPYNGSTLDNVGAGAGLGLDIFSLLSKYGGTR